MEECKVAQKGVGEVDSFHNSFGNRITTRNNASSLLIDAVHDNNTPRLCQINLQSMGITFLKIYSRPPNSYILLGIYVAKGLTSSPGINLAILKLSSHMLNRFLVSITFIIRGEKEVS